MGMITITFLGSFGYKTKSFTAMKTGHADAVAQAIQWLAQEQLPDAIHNDHKCHKDGIEPENGFAGKGLIIKKNPEKE